MTDKQPDALRLAIFCEGNVLYQPAAAELRRQHALIAELVEALRDAQIGLAADGNRAARFAEAKISAALSKAEEQQ